VHAGYLYVPFGAVELIACKIIKKYYAGLTGCTNRALAGEQALSKAPGISRYNKYVCFLKFINQVFRLLLFTAFVLAGQ
jgi:hypothetical protein